MTELQCKQGPPTEQLPDKTSVFFARHLSTGMCGMGRYTPDPVPKFSILWDDHRGISRYGLGWDMFFEITGWLGEPNNE